MLAPSCTGENGTKMRMAIQVSAPTRPTTANIQRQPKLWPRNVTAGTPSTLATESPSITQAMARPRIDAGTRVPARIAAMPKYAPCGSPARKRDTSIHS